MPINLRISLFSCLAVTLERSALGRVNLHGQAARRTILIQNSKLNIQNFFKPPRLTGQNLKGPAWVLRVR